MENLNEKTTSVKKSKRIFSYSLVKKIDIFFSYLVIIIFSLIVLLPLVWIFVTSLKNRVQIYQIPPVWFFTPTLENFAAITAKYPFQQYFFNSSFIALTTTAIALIFGSMAAYSIARFNTGGNALRLWVLNSHTMPAVALLIPFFMLATSLRLRDTYIMVIMTHLSFLLPFTIWMLIGFFDSIEKDMEEAAMVDGATRLGAFWHITLPIAAPGLSATGIVSFLFSWNEFIFAFVLSGMKTRTLPVAISAFLTQRGDLMGELSAAAMVMIIPVLILSVAFRNYLVKGLSLGAIK